MHGFPNAASEDQIRCWVCFKSSISLGTAFCISFTNISRRVFRMKSLAVSMTMSRVGMGIAKGRTISFWLSFSCRIDSSGMKVTPFPLSTMRTNPGNKTTKRLPHQRTTFFFFPKYLPAKHRVFIKGEGLKYRTNKASAGYF